MFSRLLERLALGLDRARISYMVIGGQAVLLYGEPRLTKDIDVTVGVNLDRLADMVRLAQDLKLTPLVDPETFARETMVLPCQDPDSGIRVDFVFSDSRYEQIAIDRAKPVAIGSAHVRFASLEDLIIHKLVAGRARDIEDVVGIVRKNRQLDAIYVEQWLATLGAALDQPLVHRWREIFGRESRHQG